MGEHNTDILKQDYLECEKIIKAYSKSFYYAFSQLPPHDADAVYAIYAFCRKADDTVDETECVEDKKRELKKLNSDLNAFLNGSPPDIPMWRALMDVTGRYDISMDMFQSQLTGQQMDIEFTQPSDMTELIEYCKYVAGSVGRLLLPVLSDNVDTVRHLQAEKLGIAMQITNILRDIGADAAELDRIYVPESIMKENNYDINLLKNKVINDDFIKIWETLAETAEDLYDDFMEELIYYKVEARLPLLVSMKVYREILNEIRRHEYDCFSRKRAVSSARKLGLKNEAEKILNQQFQGGGV